MSNAAARGKLTMQFKGKVGSVPAEFLADSGAGVYTRPSRNALSSIGLIAYSSLHS